MPPHDEMIRRQRVLADFGDFVLCSSNLQEVLTEACRLIAEALDTRHAKVLEIECDQGTAFVHAGVGWRTGIVGELRMPLGERSSEGYSIEVREPVVVEDIAKDERFDFPEFMKEAGIVAIVNVPIFVPGGEPFGVLQVDACEPRAFGTEDTEFLRTYATILGPVVDRLHKAADPKQAEDRNGILLRELQHRVKNDLAFVQTLVRMRAKGASPKVRHELQVIEGRIEALRLVHNQLYTGRMAGRLPVRPYVESLLENLLALHVGEAGEVRFEIVVPDLEVTPDVAGPLGLIVNEFATNSFKYAFNGRGGVLTARIEPVDDQRAALSLCDNGVGFSSTPQSASTTCGVGLIDALARQLGGEPVWSSENGVQLRLEFETS